MALSAASMGMALRVVFISLVIGVSTWGMALVSRDVGARERAAADRAAQQTEILIQVSSVLVDITGHALAPPLLRLVSTEGEMLTMAVRSARVVIL